MFPLFIPSLARATIAALKSRGQLINPSKFTFKITFGVFSKKKKTLIFIHLQFSVKHLAWSRRKDFKSIAYFFPFSVILL